MEKLHFFQKKSSLIRKKRRESNAAQHFILINFNPLILLKRLGVGQSFKSFFKGAQAGGGGGNLGSFGFSFIFSLSKAAP